MQGTFDVPLISKDFHVQKNEQKMTGIDKYYGGNYLGF